MRETRVAPCLRIKSRACDPIPLPPLLLSFGRGEKHFCSDDSRSSHLTYLCRIRLRYVKSLSIGFDLDIFFFFFFFFPFRSSLLSLDKFWVESLYTNYRIIGEEVEMKFLERWFRIEIPRRFHGNWDRWRLLCIRNVVLRHGSRTVSIDTIKFRPERLSYSSIQTQPLVAG